MTEEYTDMSDAVRVLRNGAIRVDAGKLLCSPKVQADLRAVSALYERMKAAGCNVRQVTFEEAQTEARSRDPRLSGPVDPITGIARAVRAWFKT